MLNRNDVTRFHGTVRGMSIREKVTSTARAGGGFLYRGTGFIAGPTVETRSSVVQEFWLRGAKGERNFQIVDANLPMREGHKVTALWLKKRLVAYVNHATNQVLVFDEELGALAGRKPHPSLIYALVVLLIVVLLGGAFQTVAFSPHSWAPSWSGLAALLLAGFFVGAPVGAFCFGLWRNFVYRQRQKTARNLVQQELDYLVTRNLSS